MIDFFNGKTTDILPEIFRENTEVQCVAYALSEEKKRLLNLTAQTRTMAVVDELPEKILNVLAVELRTPYYQEDMGIEKKRHIIKNTLKWHKNAGTPAAVEELVATVFGVGEVVEWFDFTEGQVTPGTFDIVTNARLTPDIAEYFTQIIQKVKNTRSHLRRVLIQRGMEMEYYVATGVIAEPEINATNEYFSEIAPVQLQKVAAGVKMEPERIVVNGYSGEMEQRQDNRLASCIVAEPRIEIFEGKNETRSESGELRCAACAVSSPVITIGNV